MNKKREPTWKDLADAAEDLSAIVRELLVKEASINMLFYLLHRAEDEYPSNNWGCDPWELRMCDDSFQVRNSDFVLIKPMPISQLANLFRMLAIGKMVWDSPVRVEDRAWHDKERDAERRKFN